MPDAHVSTDKGSEPVLDRVCLRLANRELLGEELMRSLTYARPVAADLVELFALPGDFPAAYLRDDDVARIGLDTLRAAALENLVCAPLARHKVIEWPFDTKVHELWHPAWTHTASKLLVLRDVLRRVLGRDDFPHGVLVVVPTSYELVFLPVEVCQGFGAIGPLAAYAADGFDATPGALSAQVLWWREGAVRTVLADDADGVDPDFVAMMLRVAEEERDRELGARP